MGYKTIRVEKSDGIEKIILNIPEKLNALDLVMREELKEEFANIGTDEDVRVVVMTGAGKAFCSGGDIKTMGDVSTPKGRDRLKNVQKLIKLMVELEKPIISGVNGAATGAGFHMALASDIIIASEKAKFAESFVKIGLIPDMGGLYFLPLRVGVHKAKELMFTGRMILADEAASLGIVNKTVPHEQLDEEVMQLARSLAEGPGRSYAMIKSALNNFPASLQTMLEIEANLQAVSFSTKDFKEGYQAFVEKRKPVFTGE
ncbi:MAG: enoyl-CoA hydratase [Deltaproteobacteria bacterium]|nr:enoyl-CoA hydratase [Deltaproteobacteria bacterium]